MKNKILFIASVLTLFLVFAFPCFAQEQNLVIDDFENYNLKCDESGVWNARPVVSSDGNNSAIIGAGNGQTLYAKTQGYTQDVTGIYASFSIKFNEATDRQVIFGASTGTIPSTAYDRVLQFYSGGKKMQIAAETNIPISYKTDVWYDIIIELN